MTASSYTRAISSEVGDIERRLQALQRGLEKLGTRASSNARNGADGLGEAVAAALAGWADRFRQGASSVSDQSASFGKDAARFGLQHLVVSQVRLNSAHLLLLQLLWALAFLSGWRCTVAVSISSGGEPSAGMRDVISSMAARLPRSIATQGLR